MLMVHPIVTISLSVVVAVTGCKPNTTLKIEPDQLQAYDTLLRSAGYHMLVPRPSAYHWSVIGVTDAPEYSIAFENPIQDPTQPQVEISATLFSGLDQQSPELLRSFDTSAMFKLEHHCSVQKLKEGHVGNKTWVLCEGPGDVGYGQVMRLYVYSRSKDYYFELIYTMSQMSFEKIGGMSEVERIVHTAQVW